MKRKFCFFLLLFLLVFIPYNVKAECDDSENIRLSKLAQNLNFTYVYNETTDKFTITIANTKNDLIIEYLNDGKRYSSDNELNFNNLYSGKHTFMIYSKSDACVGEYLTTKYIYLPFYNSFYGKYLCKGIENYVFCQKWFKTSYNYDYQYNNILQYKTKYEEELKKQNIIKDKSEGNTSNKIIKFIKENYVKYYYIILPIIIFVLSFIVYIKNKKDDLK